MPPSKHGEVRDSMTMFVRLYITGVGADGVAGAGGMDGAGRSGSSDASGGMNQNAGANGNDGSRRARVRADDQLSANSSHGSRG
jgi:hypothetical protein